MSKRLSSSRGAAAAAEPEAPRKKVTTKGNKQRGDEVEAEPVKTEAIPCVDGVVDKALLDKFRYNLGKAGSQAQEIFQQRFKGVHVESCPDKLQFMRDILGKNFSAADWKIKRELSHEEKTRRTTGWKCWTQIVAIKGDKLGKALVLCGKIPTQPIGITDPDVLAMLDPEDRLEYFLSEELGIEEENNKHVGSAHNQHADQVIVDEATEQEQKQQKEVAKLADIASDAKKSHKIHAGQVAENKVRLAKFEGNAYSLPLFYFYFIFL